MKWHPADLPSLSWINVSVVMLLICCPTPAVNPEYSAERKKKKQTLRFNSSEIPPGLKIMISDEKKEDEKEDGEGGEEEGEERGGDESHSKPHPRSAAASCTHTNLSTPPFASGPSVV